MRTRRHTRLSVVLLGFFLVTHSICVCTGPAFAAVATARASATVSKASAADPHACCHPKAGAPAEHRPAVPCAHCSHAELANADTVRLAAPMTTFAPATCVVIAASAVLMTSTSRGLDRPPVPHEASADIRARSCVLRL